MLLTGFSMKSDRYEVHMKLTNSMKQPMKFWNCKLHMIMLRII